jgi:hypothetical protein
MKEAFMSTAHAARLNALRHKLRFQVRRTACTAYAPESGEAVSHIRPTRTGMRTAPPFRGGQARPGSVPTCPCVRGPRCTPLPPAAAGAPACPRAACCHAPHPSCMPPGRVAGADAAVSEARGGLLRPSAEAERARSPDAADRAGEACAMFQKMLSCDGDALTFAQRVRTLVRTLARLWLH